MEAVNYSRIKKTHLTGEVFFTAPIHFIALIDTYICTGYILYIYIYIYWLYIISTYILYKYKYIYIYIYTCMDACFILIENRDKTAPVCFFHASTSIDFFTSVKLTKLTVRHESRTPFPFQVSQKKKLVTFHWILVVWEGSLEQLIISPYIIG